jgi:hypothetical protein
MIRAQKIVGFIVVREQKSSELIMTGINLSSFDGAIRSNNLREIWGDTWQPLTDAEKSERIQTKLEQARNAYCNMMSSSKNDGSLSYQNWALGTALGIKPSRAGYRKSLDGRCRA